MTRMLARLMPLLLLMGTMGVGTGAARSQAPATERTQTPAPADDEAQIRAVLAEQVAAWNRGDIPGFMSTYEDSPETTFIGMSVNKGFEPIRDRYMHAYSSPAQMGALTFSDLDVRLLKNACGKVDLALVTGRFHLQRSEKGAAKKDDGIFSLVWRKGQQGWKIVLDHTS